MILDDFREQLSTDEKHGRHGWHDGQITRNGAMCLMQLKNQVNDKSTNRMEAMINSMTKKERAKPELIKGCS